MFSRIQLSSRWDQGLVSCERAGGRKRQGNGYTGREKETERERETLESKLRGMFRAAEKKRKSESNF